MLVFVLRRAFQAVLVMLTVGFVAFLLFQYTGDPVAFMVGQDASPTERANLRRDLGLDQPFIVQFGKFVVNAVQGDFVLADALRQALAITEPTGTQDSKTGAFAVR